MAKRAISYTKGANQAKVKVEVLIKLTRCLSSLAYGLRNNRLIALIAANRAKISVSRFANDADHTRDNENDKDD